MLQYKAVQLLPESFDECRQLEQAKEKVAESNNSCDSNYYAIYIHVSMQITNEELHEEFNALAGVWGNEEFKSVNKTAYSKI